MAYISAIYYMKYPEQQSNLAKHLEAVRDKAYANFYNWHTSTTAISKFIGGTQRLLDASFTNSTLVSYSHAYKVYY